MANTTISTPARTNRSRSTPLFGGFTDLRKDAGPPGALDRYLEAEVLNADPVKLVRLLYRGALEAIAAARRALARTGEPGAIAERSRQVLRAWRIVSELGSALDHQRGGDLSRRLAELYAYIAQILLHANIQQSGALLVEAEALLATLAEAWTSVSYTTPPQPDADYSPVSVAC